MAKSKYLIIGGGVAADAAVRGIRELDDAGSILVVSDEHVPPYDRPPLSKALWKGAALDTIWRRTDSADAELRLGTRIVALDPKGKTATDASGAVFGYEQLLLATGGTPRRLRNACASTIYFRKLIDFKSAWEAAQHGSEFAVIGGGFIGSEIAAALAMNGRKVSQIFPGACIGDRLYPRPLANFLNLYFRKHGVDVRFNERVERIERQADKLVVRTDRTNSNCNNTVETVIAGVGIKPNVALAKAAGLEVRNGIVVDEMLRTSDPDIFAAGDVANFPCAALGRRLRFDHEDNARSMGRTAGHNMTGEREPYRHVPSFYSYLFDLGYEAVGEIDSRMDIVEDWEQKFLKGTLYYLRDGLVRGVLLWNSWGLLDNARSLIAMRRQQRPAELIGRLRGVRRGAHEQVVATSYPTAISRSRH
jgi:3-phenylpropionate/trans-cinnamate dioxygenase ferredoxin reductase component